MSFTERAGGTTPNLAGLVEINGTRICGTFDGTYWGTYELHRLGGVLDGGPDLRFGVDVLPSDDGGYSSLPFYNPRAILLEGLLTVPVLDDIWGARDRLMTVFNIVSIPGVAPPLQTLMVNTTSWANPRFLSVRIAGPLSWVEPDGLAKLTPDRLFSVPLIAPDPLMYKGTGPADGTTLTSTAVITTTLTNNGNANTPFVVRFTGPSTNPTLSGPGLTGKQIIYTGSIASGHYVEVGTNPTGDGSGLYATQDGSTDVMGNITALTARVVPPGTSSWGYSGGGTCTVSFRDAWL